MITKGVQRAVMKTIRELAESMEISKESVYKKIKYQLKVELKDHVFKGNNGTLIDEAGENIILQSLRRERATSFETKLSEQPDIVKTEKIESVYLVNILEQQLAEKDKQIVTLMNSRDELMRSKNLYIEKLLEINGNLINTFQNDQKIKLANTLQLQSNQDEFLEQNLYTQTETNGEQGKLSETPLKKNFLDKIFRR